MTTEQSPKWPQEFRSGDGELKPICHKCKCAAPGDLLQDHLNAGWMFTNKTGWECLACQKGDPNRFQLGEIPPEATAAVLILRVPGGLQIRGNVINDKTLTLGILENAKDELLHNYAKMRMVAEMEQERTRQMTAALMQQIR